MTSPAVTSAEWQELLDERFPEGALVSRVLPDGSLSGDVMYLCPVLVVMSMRDEWPMIVGIGTDGHDVQIHAVSWEEIDRSGHFVARVHSEASASDVRDHFEISSWLSPVAVASMTAVRESQRDWLIQVSESAQADLDPAAVASPDEDR